MEPTVIKSFPGQAVDEFRKRHHGFLPGEESLWLDSLITALKANLTSKVTIEELDELHKLALQSPERSEWVSVPREPTQAICDAILNTFWRTRDDDDHIAVKKIYKAMLSAAK